MKLFRRKYRDDNFEEATPEKTVGAKELYKLFTNNDKGDLEYVYRGYFTPGIVSSIMDLTRHNIKEDKDASKIRKKIYYIIGEGLQNITRHQDVKRGKYERNALCIIHKKKGKFYITTANAVEQEKITELKERIDTINSLSSDELRAYSREIKKTKGLSEKGGAGLGLIEMAKRSGNKLLYGFDELDEEFSEFYLHTKIGDEKIETSGELGSPQQSFAKVILFHKFLNSHNIKLFFNGDFDQENMLSLLALFEEQTTKSRTIIKIFNLMVEMIQNIIKHADNIGGRSIWKPGVFYLRTFEGNYELAAGNYIVNEKISHIKNRIELINNFNEKELSLYRTSILSDSEMSDPVKTGLGFTDLLKKSKNKLEYDFFSLEDNMSFYILKVKLKIED